MRKRKRSRPSRQPPEIKPPTFNLLVKRSRSSKQQQPTALTLIPGRSAESEARQAVSQFLEGCRRQYEQGNHKALLDALFAWLSSYKGPPDWIADAFCEKLLDWFEYRAPALDAAFGVRRPPRKHLKTLRERNALRGEILMRIERRRAQGEWIDIKLFELVGAEVGKSGSFVSDVYYEDASKFWRDVVFPKLKIRTMSEK